MPIFFDLETQNTFEDVGGRFPERLKISIAVTYNTADQAFHRYEEKDAAQLAADLAQADLVVGYNVLGFDYPVLQKYAPEIQLSELPTLDMMAEIHKRLGYRVGLGAVATATLDAGKSADGLQAVRWWREGRVDLIFEYCEQDVAVTRDIYEFGKKNRYVQFFDRNYRLQKVMVSW